MTKLTDGILILSHPDDECLFASSILDKISTLIICFENIPNEENISIGRKNALYKYPLKNLKVIKLCLTQSLPSFFPNNWSNIKDKYSGIKGGYEEKSYDKNYHLILNELRKIIPRKSVIFSHNPWGEYGHEDHSQVFKAAFKISNETESKLYVTGYCGNLTKSFSQRKLHLLTSEYFIFQTNYEIFDKLKNHYLRNGCWTWYKKYSLPSIELFYKININLDSNSISNIEKCNKYPLLYIDNDYPYKSFIKKSIKKIIPYFVKNFLRKGRVYIN